MVDTIAELAELSRQLNQSSDKINSIISTINKKLATLNLGITAWVTQFPIETDDSVETPDDFGEPIFPNQKNVAYLGYCKLEGDWQLALKKGILQEFSRSVESVGVRAAEVTDVTYVPLLKASRELRARAIGVVPSLLDMIKNLAEHLLRNIEHAEKAAAKL